MRNRAKD